MYNNLNKVQEAEDKLLSLKQGTDSLYAYIAKFERVLYEAQGQNWPDVNKISTFKSGLNSTIQGRLSQQLNLPRKYSDFVRVVQQLAGRSSSSAHATLPDNTKHHGEPMEIGYIGSMDFTTKSQPPSPTYSQHARSTSPQLREQYRLQGRCVRCGSYKHWVSGCPLQPAKKRELVAVLDDNGDTQSEASCSSFNS